MKHRVSFSLSFLMSIMCIVILGLSSVSCSEDGSLGPLQDGSVLQIDGQNSDSQNDNELSDEEEITSLLSRFQLYTRFTQYDSASLAVDFQNPDESRQYFKVIDEEYTPWSKWLAFAESIFCDEYLAERLENDTVIKNVDGETYCQPGSMGWPISEDYELSFIERDEESCLIIMKHKEIGSESKIEFQYKLKHTDAGWRIAGQ